MSTCPLAKSTVHHFTLKHIWVNIDKSQVAPKIQSEIRGLFFFLLWVVCSKYKAKPFITIKINNQCLSGSSNKTNVFTLFSATIHFYAKIPLHVLTTSQQSYYLCFALINQSDSYHYIFPIYSKVHCAITIKKLGKYDQ